VRRPLQEERGTAHGSPVRQLLPPLRPRTESRAPSPRSLGAIGVSPVSAGAFTANSIVPSTTEGGGHSAKAALGANGNLHKGTSWNGRGKMRGTPPPPRPNPIWRQQPKNARPSPNLKQPFDHSRPISRLRENQQETKRNPSCELREYACGVETKTAANKEIQHKHKLVASSSTHNGKTSWCDSLGARRRHEREVGTTTCHSIQKTCGSQYSMLAVRCAPRQTSLRGRARPPQRGGEEEAGSGTSMDDSLSSTHATPYPTHTQLGQSKL
jgi:hypothetical protein